MKTYIIDGNNLIGKTKHLMLLQNKDKQSSREQLVFMIDNYFHNKNQDVYIHLDGFKSTAINPSKSRLIYSNSKTADETIKRQIEQTVNKKNIVVVTSDNNLREFAKVCRSDVMLSEEFLKLIESGNQNDDEAKRINEMNNNDEFKKLFGAD